MIAKKAGEGKSLHSPQICQFYKFGRCKFGKKCKEPHPKPCENFLKHGLKKYNADGCSDDCNDYHPYVCRNSLKRKECFSLNCQNKHLRGTKRNDSNRPVDFQWDLGQMLDFLKIISSQQKAPQNQGPPNMGYRNGRYNGNFVPRGSNNWQQRQQQGLIAGGGVGGGGRGGRR